MVLENSLGQKALTDLLQPEKESVGALMRNVNISLTACLQRVTNVYGREGNKKISEGSIFSYFSKYFLNDPNQVTNTSPSTQVISWVNMTTSLTVFFFLKESKRLSGVYWSHKMDIWMFYTARPLWSCSFV